ncbi:NAD-dependent epimerase/dehydratase family protein [Pseudoalteromonas sp. SSDWG2]|uniref:NAD-dependent epimerase/dehydratase family protein n=1 Tax=Pseudoalteromonas sp. SSDWG2 TaxID=3139391 RepID=UPI003BAD46B6
MKVLVTGSAGRVGRAIYIKLMRSFTVVGIDKTPCSTADYVGDIRDERLIKRALKDVDVVVHTAALHAPHVELFSNKTFHSINVDSTEQLALRCIELGVKHFIFTSTTALYGYASTPQGIAGWVDEEVTPQPRSIYHHTKRAAEHTLEALALRYNMPVTVLQMSRCFPESADLMAVYRLNRGIDARDAASAHQAAIEKRLSGFQRFIISAKTPFSRHDVARLYHEADVLLAEKCPALADAFAQRGWQLPSQLDRVYDSSKAQKLLEWTPCYGFESVLAMLDDESSEVLPVLSSSSLK